MTGQERSDIAALGATLSAFMAMYMRDQETTKEVRNDLQSAIDKTRQDLLAAHEEHNIRIRAFEDLRQKAGGMVLILGVIVAALSVPLALFWNAALAWVARP